MDNYSKINDVAQREAESKEERLLLGFLYDIAQRLKYGEVTVAFTIRNGQVTRMKSEREIQTFNLDT